MYCYDTEKQECTQSYVRRPYGVGLLVAGVDVRILYGYEYLYKRILISKWINRKKGLIYTKLVRLVSSMNTEGLQLVLVLNLLVHTWKNTMNHLAIVSSFLFLFSIFLVS
jgi:hypothetical protein